jgi:hypothetical protein
MLTIFTTIKNEANSILEWLAFHKLQGFQHFLLGIDQCNDNTKELIENSQFANNCELIDLQQDRFKVDNTKIEQYYLANRQTLFLNHAIEILKERNTEWALTIDVDEYVYSPVGWHLINILDDYPEDGVIVCERVFGSGGLQNRPNDSLVIETFTKHVEDNLDLSRVIQHSSIDPSYFKTFVRPSQVIGYTNSHSPYTKSHIVYEDHAKRRMSNGTARTKRRPSNILRLNHYFTQDRAHWEAKLERGRISGSPRYDEDLYQIYEKASLEDNYLKNNWAKKVKQLLQKEKMEKECYKEED